ncbi:MAG: hypothetical protein L0Z53_01885 [Acidobacteriales bacterium]|nr:hypothetical protein [Terriglobales bacterium]
MLLGPGCLNFSLVLSLTSRPALRVVRDSMRIILAAVARGLALQSVRSAGMSDLTWQGRKFSGNAQRRGRHALLHHGTILYNFDIARVSEFLHEPRRQPTYRMQRSHEQFLCNIPLDPQRIRQGLAWAFHAVRKNCR